MAARNSNGRASAHNGSQVQSIPFNQVDPPEFNPREDFDPAEIKKLAESIAAHGLLQAPIVRPAGKRFELVAGERRFRAVQLLGWEDVPCSVRELDDRETAEIRLLENLDRKDLGPLETAWAFKHLMELGHDRESLAKLCRLPAEMVTNRLGLLDMPAEWKERVRKGELSAAHVEKLVAWRKYPAVMERMDQYADQEPVTLSEWKRRLVECVFSLSRSMDPVDPTGPRFDLTEEDLGRLDVVEVAVAPGRIVKRAMNAGLWDVLQDQADLAAAAAIAKGRKPAEQQDYFSRNIPAGDGAAAAAGAAENGDGEFWTRLAKWKRAWLMELANERLESVSLVELEHAVEAIGVDPARQWRLSKDFLRLYANGRLEDLAAELGVDVAAAETDAERIAVLLHAQPRTMPNDLQEVNASEMLVGA